ncbi:hypothetical protein BKA83DRAFT_4493380 [Pisolithus microcarpus]|nr:hypothetical protein BKA83DRAFT_4493380 [Pisolithus microcarpus]
MQYTKCLEHNITQKAYAMFTAQLARHFMVAISLTCQQYHLHIFNCSGAIHSSAHSIHRHTDTFSHLLYILAFGDPQHLGFDPTFLNPALSPSPLYHPITDTTLKVAWTIKVKNHLYAVLGCIFASNDYWTHRGRRHTKEEMLNKIKGLKGLPTLDAAWMVQIDRNDGMTALLWPASIFGNTSFETRIHQHLLMMPVGCPLLEFSLLQELLSIFIDIVLVHHTLVCIYMILHHDVSINNILMYMCSTPWDASSKEEKEWEKIIQKKKFC